MTICIADYLMQHYRTKIKIHVEFLSKVAYNLYRNILLLSTVTWAVLSTAIMGMERRGKQSISLSRSRIAEMTTSAVTNRVSPVVLGYLRGLWGSHFGRVYLLTVPGSFFHAASITKIKKQRHREFALCRCMLYTLYKPLTYYLLFCPVGVSGRRYTLPERSWSE